MCLDTELRCVSPKGERTLALRNFVKDAYTTALDHDELISEIVVKLPPANSGGAYLAFKRCAPVYASAAVAVQLTLEDNVCRHAAVYLGAVGLMAVHAEEAEAALRGQTIDAKSISAASEAARAAADPQPDMRGSAEYKRTLVAALTRRAIEVAAQRARSESVEVSHYYA